MTSRTFKIEVDEETFNRLWGHAWRFGFYREDPKLTWREPEKREAAKAAINGCIKGFIHSTTSEDK